jgi:endonuclease-3 related protein
VGIGPDADTYDGWQELFMGALPGEPELFNEYHALIVRLGKEHCQKAPECGGCPVLEVCAFGPWRSRAEATM